MKTTDVQRIVLEILSYPYAWEKVGLGHLPVGPVADYCRDRSVHLAQELWDVLHDRGIEDAARAGETRSGTSRASLLAAMARSNGAFGKRLRAGEVVGIDDDGPIVASYRSRYPSEKKPAFVDGRDESIDAVLWRREDADGVFGSVFVRRAGETVRQEPQSWVRRDVAMRMALDLGLPFGEV